jgi:hypothetical protein
LVTKELVEVLRDHEELYEQYDIKKFPQTIITGSYQDGLIHGYKMIIDGRNGGRFSDLHQLQSNILGYQNKINEYRKSKCYFDVAYFQLAQSWKTPIVLLRDFISKKLVKSANKSSGE